MNRKLKATIALLVVISIIMSFIPFRALAFNEEERQNYAQIQLYGVTDVNNDEKTFECGNEENHYATVTVEDENAILEKENDAYYLYTSEESFGLRFNVENNYIAFVRENGAANPSMVMEETYYVEDLEKGSHYNLDFEFRDNNQNPGENPGENPGDESNIDVQFDTQSIEGNVATFNVDDEEITVTVSGADIENGHVQVDRNNLSGVTFTVSENFNKDTMWVAIRGANYYNVTIELEEENSLSLEGLNIPNGGIHFSVEHKHNSGEESPQIPAPELEEGYLVTSIISEDGTDGGIVYYFVNSQGKYLQADGTVLNEQQQPAGTITANDENKKVAIPENTATIRIGLYTGDNTDAYMTTLYHNEDVENVEKDSVKYSTIPVNYTVGDSIGFSVGFYAMPAIDVFVPEEAGTYIIPYFPEETEDVTILYVDQNGEEQIINHETNIEDIRSYRNAVTLQIPAGKLDSIHADVFDENMNRLDVELYNLLGSGAGDENDPFFAWIQKIENGEKATLDLSSLNENYSYVFNVNILNPHEAEMAHVLSWTNVVRPYDNPDLLIDGGFAQLVQALDEDGNEIWNINEEYDESCYLFDDQGNRTGKFIYGDELGFPWERGPMYAFAIDQNEDGGEVEAVEGIQLIFEFIPVYGKQLTYVSLGEVEGDAQGDAKYYKVTMPPRHTHFNAQFEEINDEKLIGEDSKVTSLEYVLDEEALDSGTAVLSIDKVTGLSNEQKQGFLDVVGSDYEVSTYLDVDLKQVWFKGRNAVFDENNGYSEDDVWSEEIYDLGDKKATITITLDEGITPDDVVILHEVHDFEGNVIGYEKVKILNKVQNENGIWTVTFETSRFSNYAIAEKIAGTPDSYTVTFNTNDGTEIEAQEVASGTTAVKPANPTKEDYVFGGWYADETLEIEFDFDTSITQNTILYAKWNEKIEEVNITVLSPKAGDTINVYDEDGWYRQNIEPVAITERMADYDITGAAWIYGTYEQIGDNFEDMFEGTIEENKYYYVEVFIDTHEGYGFDNNLTINVNGQSPEEVFAIYNGTSTKFIAKVKSVNPEEKYTMTIVNEHGENVVLENIEYGTQVSQLQMYYIYRALQQEDVEGYGFITIARKALSEYSSNEELAEDSLNVFGGSIYDDYITEDTTYYSIWFEYIDEVEMTITAPVCGTSTTTDVDEEDEWDAYSQTNRPQVSIPNGAHYSLGGRLYYFEEEDFPGALWIEIQEDEEGAGMTGPFIGTFEGGEKYDLMTLLVADFGYMFPSSYSSNYEPIDDGIRVIIHGGEEIEHYVPNFISMMYGLFYTSSFYEGIEEVEAVHDWGEWVVTKEATVDEAGSKTRTCKRNESHTETEEIEKTPYKIIEGANQTIEVEDGKDLIVKTNGSVNKLIRLLVDNIEVDEENYTIESGSTIATLTSSFLDTLSSGNHILTLVYTDGQVQTNFKIARASDTVTEEDKTISPTTENTQEKSNPKTGDQIITYVIMLVAGVLGLMSIKKLKRYNKTKKH